MYVSAVLVYCFHTSLVTRLKYSVIHVSRGHNFLYLSTKRFIKLFIPRFLHGAWYILAISPTKQCLFMVFYKWIIFFLTYFHCLIVDLPYNLWCCIEDYGVVVRVLPKSLFNHATSDYCDYESQNIGKVVRSHKNCSTYIFPQCAPMQCNHKLLIWIKAVFICPV